MNFEFFNRYEALTDEELQDIVGGSLPENIRNIRIELGWTQEQLADKVFVSKQAIHNYEVGNRTPNLDILKSLAKLFHKSLDELVK